jgi:hypothetical protein
MTVARAHDEEGGAVGGAGARQQQPKRRRDANQPDVNAVIASSHREHPARKNTADQWTARVGVFPLMLYSSARCLEYVSLAR